MRARTNSGMVPSSSSKSLPISRSIKFVGSNSDASLHGVDRLGRPGDRPGGRGEQVMASYLLLVDKCNVSIEMYVIDPKRIARSGPMLVDIIDE